MRSSFGRGPFYGAWGIDEQKAPGKAGCCSRVGLGSDTSRWAAMNALLYARTGDAAARENAFRSLNYATYFARSDGRVACCGKRSAAQVQSPAWRCSPRGSGPAAATIRRHRPIASPR